MIEDDLKLGVEEKYCAGVEMKNGYYLRKAKNQ